VIVAGGRDVGGGESRIRREESVTPNSRPVVLYIALSQQRSSVAAG